jgi:CheY-like chemotaxis protein
LVAEDNVVNRRLATRLLEMRGHVVLTANDGHEAVGIHAREPLDLVLMDLQMPGMDGIEATRAIRRHERSTGAARTPIVALTACATLADREQCLKAGMDDYLSKPLRAAELFQAVERCTFETVRH